MINNQIAYYLGSKILAAILNLLTMAVFVRMGGKETYGLYVIQLAWVYMLYSVTMQWLRFSFFACFRQNIREDMIKTYLYTLLIACFIVVSGAMIVILTGYITFKFAVGIIVLVLGLACYEAFIEIARIQLQARNVAIGVVMRATLMFVFGVIALSWKASAFLLIISVGLAHFGAALVLMFRSRVFGQGKYSSRHMKSLWLYGRPLVPAFGLDAVGLQMDRLLLARLSTIETVGIYGAAADFIRQSMIVVAEAISGAYFPVARQAAEEGKTDEAKEILGQAFLAYTALTFLVGVFILRFDRLVFDSLFGTEMGAAIAPIAGLIVLVNIVGIYRAYYLIQALYLTKKSHLLLYADGIQVGFTLIFGIFLVPEYSSAGAAIAMFLGQIAGSLVYISVWRHHYILQLPYAKAGYIIAAALLFYGASGLIEGLLSGALGIAMNIGLFGLVSIAICYRFNILSFRVLALKLLNRKAGGIIS